MNIQFENYRLEPSDNRFDLYKTKKNTKEKAFGKKIVNETVEVCMGYSMDFEYCLHIIAVNKLANKTGTTSIPEWIKEYKAIKNELLNSLKR